MKKRKLKKALARARWAREEAERKIAVLVEALRFYADDDARGHRAYFALAEVGAAPDFAVTGIEMHDPPKPGDEWGGPFDGTIRIPLGEHPPPTPGVHYRNLSKPVAFDFEAIGHRDPNNNKREPVMATVEGEKVVLESKCPMGHGGPDKDGNVFPLEGCSVCSGTDRVRAEVPASAIVRAPRAFSVSSAYAGGKVEAGVSASDFERLVQPVRLTGEQAFGLPPDSPGQEARVTFPTVKLEQAPRDLPAEAREATSELQRVVASLASDYMPSADRQKAVEEAHLWIGRALSVFEALLVECRRAGERGTRRRLESGPRDVWNLVSDFRVAVEDKDLARVMRAHAALVQELEAQRTSLKAQLPEQHAQRGQAAPEKSITSSSKRTWWQSSDVVLGALSVLRIEAEKAYEDASVGKMCGPGAWEAFAPLRAAIDAVETKMSKDPPPRRALEVLAEQAEIMFWALVRPGEPWGEDRLGPARAAIAQGKRMVTP